MPRQGTPSTLVARVINDVGRAFNVVLVRSGDSYGRNNTLVNDSNDALVEFYDATYENDRRFHLGRGQFIIRYYLSTLANGRGTGGVGVSSVESTLHGLDLCGHVPEWKITSQNIEDALATIRKVYT